MFPCFYSFINIFLSIRTFFFLSLVSFFVSLLIVPVIVYSLLSSFFFCIVILRSAILLLAFLPSLIFGSPVPLKFSPFSFFYLFAIFTSSRLRSCFGLRASRLSCSPACFPIPCSVEQYSAQESTRHNVRRFIALSNHPGHFLISQNNYSRDTAEVLAASIGITGDVEVPKSSVRSLLRQTSRSCILRRTSATNWLLRICRKQGGAQRLCRLFARWSFLSSMESGIDYGFF